MKRITVALVALGILGLLIGGCTSQDRTYAIYPSIECEPGGESVVTGSSGQKFKGGNIIYFEILVDAEAVSDTQATNKPDVSPALSIPLP